MGFIIAAIVLTSLAAITGIIAVGNGRHWDFKPSDYIYGKRNAVIYLWVIASTIFSMCHSGTLVEYGLATNWTLLPGDQRWMIIHATAGALFVCAHLFVVHTLGKEVGPRDKYLWGTRRGL